MLRYLKVGIGIVVAVSVAMAYHIARMALIAEERLHAIAFTIELLEEFIRKHDGEWPTSWAALDSSPTEASSYYSGIARRDRLRAFVTVNFGVITCEVAKQKPDTFSAVQPIGPCSKSYLLQAERLIQTAKGFCDSEQKRWKPSS